MTLDEAWQAAMDTRPHADVAISLSGPVNGRFVARCLDGQTLPSVATASGATAVEALQSLTAKMRALRGELDFISPS